MLRRFSSREGITTFFALLPAIRAPCFSERGFNSLIDHAKCDDILAETIGFRHDVPEPCFLRLLCQASDLVRRKLSEAYPDRAALVDHVVERIKDEIAPERDYSIAERLISDLKGNNDLTEATLLFFVKNNRFEEVAGVPGGENRPDGQDRRRCDGACVGRSGS